MESDDTIESKGRLDSIPGNEEKMVIDEESTLNGSSPEIATHRPDTFSQDRAEAIRKLARTFSHLSRHSRSGNPPSNPFSPDFDTSLDPNSSKFDIEYWLKSYLSILSEDQERYPKRTAGVSYRDLDIYGTGKPADYQKDVFNVLLAGIDKVRGAFRDEPKVTILKDFDGLIRPGEMCVVLGRPGR